MTQRFLYPVQALGRKKVLITAKIPDYTPRLRVSTVLVEGLIRVGFYPGTNAVCVSANAEEIGGDEPKLVRSKADDADYKTVSSGEKETGPALLTYENSGQNSKTAG